MIGRLKTSALYVVVGLFWAIGGTILAIFVITIPQAIFLGDGSEAKMDGWIAVAIGGIGVLGFLLGEFHAAAEVSPDERVPPTYAMVLAALAQAPGFVIPGWVALGIGIVAGSVVGLIVLSLPGRRPSSSVLDSGITASGVICVALAATVLVGGAVEATPNPSAAQHLSDQQEENCLPDYDPCVPDSEFDLDCPDIGHGVRVVGTDVYGFDRDGDGAGCESW